MRCWSLVTRSSMVDPASVKPRSQAPTFFGAMMRMEIAARGITAPPKQSTPFTRDDRIDESLAHSIWG